MLAKLRILVIINGINVFELWTASVMYNAWDNNRNNLIQFLFASFTVLESVFFSQIYLGDLKWYLFVHILRSSQLQWFFPEYTIFSHTRCVIVEMCFLFVSSCLKFTNSATLGKPARNTQIHYSDLLSPQLMVILLSFLSRRDTRERKQHQQQPWGTVGTQQMFVELNCIFKLCEIYLRNKLSKFHIIFLRWEVITWFLMV